ncbi:class I SAM-dependent methyltransferase [Desulfovibrio desulfuricans]|uniref:class I SAM-dependent methyltransferase n=1 Tax=Desulfovibrio desulfuricans TaxID=876 RepID=UPI001C02BE7F|nr:methyltransferase domain-containing protein [Desulfovibrio desulfuricans]
MVSKQIWPIHTRKNFLPIVLDKIATKLGKTPGFCNICGNVTFFDTSITPHRGNCICLNCKSRNRQRQIAYFILQKMTTNGHSKNPFSTIFPSIKHLKYNGKIWISETSSPLALVLKQLPNCITSEFINESTESGTRVGNTLHINMCKTHFADNSLDLIISGDVLEHIPDYKLALRETYRILSNGGYHIFTIPFYQHRFSIEHRSLYVNKELVHLKHPWFHLDPMNPKGILCYNIFAPELLSELEEIGFEASLNLIFSPSYGMFGQDGIVIVAKKITPAIHLSDWVFPETL